VPKTEPSCNKRNVTTSPSARSVLTNCNAHSVSPSVVVLPKSIAPPPDVPSSVWPAPPSKVATSAVSRRVQSPPSVRTPLTALTPAEVVVIVTQPAELIWYWNVKSTLFCTASVVIAKRSRNVVSSAIVCPVPTVGFASSAACHPCVASLPSLEPNRKCRWVSAI